MLDEHKLIVLCEIQIDMFRKTGVDSADALTCVFRKIGEPKISTMIRVAKTTRPSSM
ncbi:hypothetical protein Mapa_010961 [Marchantia paleacea]|nr:hypothetical protein Mapa_010961 [Marchantia paleacea]